MSDIQQLVKKNTLGETYNNIFPKTFFDAITDKETGTSLKERLAMFNMLFLSYVGSKSLTRTQVPLSFRREGLWVTYVMYDKTVVTEWYTGEAVDNTSWGNDSNWRNGSNSLVGDITISSTGYWVINGVISEIKAQGDAGITPILRIGDNNHLQVSYTNGATYIDVDSNPVFTQFRINDNKLQQSLDLGISWEDVSDYIASWFKFTGTTGSSQADNVGKIQISRDNGATWSDLSGEFTNSLHIKGYVATVGALPSSAVQGDIYGVGPTYDPSDTGQTNPIYQLYVKDSTGWVNNGRFTSIAAGVVQTTGTSTTEVMSQKAVTDNLELKIDKTSIKQVLGTSTTDVMSQKGITDAIETLDQQFSEKENIANKVTSWSLSLSNDKYPAEKLVKESIDKEGRKIAAKLSSVEQVEDEGFYVVDKHGNIVMKFDDVLDTIGIGENLKNIIKELLFRYLPDINICEVEDEGFYVVDENGNIGMKFDDVLDAIGIGDALTTIIDKKIKTSEFSTGYKKAYNRTYAETKKLKEETERLINSISSIKEPEGNNFGGNITIPMSLAAKDIDNCVIRLGLHYGNRIGSVTPYDVFFSGNVKKDFSDVRIKDSNGNILPIQLLHYGNYEVVRDNNLGSSVIAMDSNGDLYKIVNGYIHKSSDEFRTSIRLPNQSTYANNDQLFFDSKGGLWYNYNAKLYVCYPVNGVYDFTNTIETLDFTISNGVHNVGPNFKVTENGVIEDSAEYIYMGQYQVNLNPVIFRSINPLGPNGIIPDAQGNYFKEAYHQEIVYLPDGVTVDIEKVDQHVHHIHTFIAKDANGNDVDNIIAGLDSGSSKGANLISSIDHGETWVSFRDLNIDGWRQQFAKDYSITDISVDRSYAFTNGESDILGGMSMWKLYIKVDAEGRITPDALAYPVNTGQATRMVNMKDESFILNAFCASEESCDMYNLIVSEDKGKSWKSIYHEYNYLTVSGAGDGARWIQRFNRVANGAELNEICWYGTGQNTDVNAYSPLRIYKGGEHYYGEMLVYVGHLEAGTDVTLTVESGYAVVQPNSIVLNSNVIEPIWSLDFNEGAGSTVEDSNGLSHKIIGDYEWDEPETSKRIFQYIPMQRDYDNIVGGVKLSIGSYINIGKIPQLKFRKNFSVLIWLACGDYEGYTLPNKEYPEGYLPIINSNDFCVGHYYWYGGYAGGKAGGKFAYGNIQSSINKANVRLYKPFLYTFSDDNIPTVKCYVSDRDCKMFTSPSSWLDKDICDIELKIGSPETVYRPSHDINKNYYIGTIAFYDKELTADEVRSVLNGRGITDDYNNIFNI